MEAGESELSDSLHHVRDGSRGGTGWGSEAVMGAVQLCTPSLPVTCSSDCLLGQTSLAWVLVPPRSASVCRKRGRSVLGRVRRPKFVPGCPQSAGHLHHSRTGSSLRIGATCPLSTQGKQKFHNQPQRDDVVTHYLNNNQRHSRGESGSSQSRFPRCQAIRGCPGTTKDRDTFTRIQSSRQGSGWQGPKLT